MLQGREEKQVLSENWLRILRRLANVRTTKVSGDIALYADVCSSGSECFQREGRWGWLPRQAFPSWEETPPGFGPDQAPFCSLKRGRTEGSLEMKSPPGGTLGRWQVARGSFCMKNHELTVAGMKRDRSDSSTVPLGSCSWAARWLKPRKPWWKKQCFSWQSKDSQGLVKWSLITAFAKI